ncbi:MAG: hypothetical protein E4G99_02930 [Anaerolineales bacterium]|nr:MAG: hypothetical protein E4G99_02930 [Anaerolineales bacterium]
MKSTFFPLLILNARPAAGKSELIQALRATPVETRIARFHIGPMHIIDDFPMLWAWFEEDRFLETVFQRPRLHTTPDEHFLHSDLWHLLIRRLCLDYEKWLRDSKEQHTVILEFSRGSEHGGYQAAYEHLSGLVLREAASMYLRVSFAESLRKNNRRFNPDRPDSILEHSLSAEKLARLYQSDDWDRLTEADPNHLHIQDRELPYVVFENEDDLTTQGGEALFIRLEECLGRLWSLREAKRAG